MNIATSVFCSTKQEEIYDGFSSVKRIVIKVGTSTLAHNTGNLNIRRVSKLIEVMSDLKNSGKDVIFVTSGAQGVGAAKAGLHSKPKEMPKSRLAPL